MKTKEGNNDLSKRKGKFNQFQEEEKICLNSGKNSRISESALLFMDRIKNEGVLLKY